MIDLRSDTVTLPTEEMRDAMGRAELGDDSRDGDPTVRKLEQLAADMSGKAAGLLVTSGTMANLVALLAHTGRGGEVLLDGDCHILRTEMGGIAGLAGLFHSVVPATRGAPDLDALRALLRPRLAINRLATALVCIETSHNDAGGAVIPLSNLAKVREMTGEAGIPVHIDGARLFNAAVALGVPASDIARHADSVCFCISKGLSAPIGSLVCGSAAFIERARAFRRMAGGAMRQAGVIAAAGIVGLETMVERLADDHKRARAIAQKLHALDARFVNPELVETNIVRIDVGGTGRDAPSWAAALLTHGVRAGVWNATSLRLVTHRHIDDAAVDQVVAAFGAIQANGGRHGL
jgi:threonine aldolase